MHSTSIQNTEYQERGPGFKQGFSQRRSASGVALPGSGSTALYCYHDQTLEHRRATQFENDHWGLRSCCDSQVHSYTSPPDPQALDSPCPTLKDENGNLLSFYGNPYDRSSSVKLCTLRFPLTQYLSLKWNRRERCIHNLPFNNYKVQNSN